MIDDNTAEALTGRISRPPSTALRELVLEPQFQYESEHLLEHYVQVEKVLLTEYQRMGVLDARQVRHIAIALGDVVRTGLSADPVANLSDIALAIERHVTGRLDVPSWHVDRSRNDLQASVQLMFGRDQALHVIADMLSCASAAQRLAARHTDDIMPGFTHLQAAQVITPGFFVSAISAHLLHTVRRMLATYDAINLCPLGSGALAGQELAWDRDRMADLLAFAGAQPHALVGVASRGWLLEIAGECSTSAVGLSRLLTDLMTWAGSEHGLVELPDELAGISSAMPQKKNYPILERIRGRTAHLTSWYVDVATAQRNTPYSNTVEVSKESSAQLSSALGTLRSLLRLLTEVFDKAVFRTEHGRLRCTEEYLGGFSLANRLTIDQHVPWRDAQVIAGRYVVAALEAGLGADSPDGSLLGAIAVEQGYAISGPERLLRDAFDPQAELRRRRSRGSARPEEVSRLLAAQKDEYTQLENEISARRAALDAMPARIDRVLTSVPDVMPGMRPGEWP
jgi:argininosuccinate lyase